MDNPRRAIVASDGAFSYDDLDDASKRVAGSLLADNEDLNHLHRPTSIDWFKDGTFMVSDGYSNTRVVKYDKDGKPLMKWGTRGKGPGEFNGPHGVAVSANGDRVFVSDRGNARIQVFDASGKFIEEWPGIRANARIGRSSALRSR